jgi:hypothetical protein
LLCYTELPCLVHEAQRVLLLLVLGVVGWHCDKHIQLCCAATTPQTLGPRATWLTAGEDLWEWGSAVVMKRGAGSGFSLLRYTEL